MVSRALILCLAQCPLAIHGLQPTKRGGSTHALIPSVLHLISREDAYQDLPRAIFQNIQDMQRLNPGLEVKYWGHKACKRLLHQQFSADLVKFFKNSDKDAERDDICRVAALYHEGGFYMDPDVQLNVALLDIIEPDTTFLGVRHSNMLMAAAPRSPILADTLKWIPAWHVDLAGGLWHGLIGPSTLDKAFADACDCGMSCLPDAVRYRCGSETVQLYREAFIKDKMLEEPSSLMPQERLDTMKSLQEMKLGTGHLQFAIVSPTLDVCIGWSRFSSCIAYGCGGELRDKDEQEDAEAQSLNVLKAEPPALPSPPGPQGLTSEPLPAFYPRWGAAAPPMAAEPMAPPPIA
eukprot:CAMPEP_0179339858 /NCGR_PEP_ID=MMETSP0797-20121207/68954_1 /TAXON_ID=47934 /ORGANISM="Dinophysis acuminata, Strain DAEP01" /LENGTH=348 /DNA_ID=CAMNT_0021053747 /DNA_START=17 /DNA_END=1059 /DNA_ORIENTATION=-